MLGGQGFLTAESEQLGEIADSGGIVCLQEAVIGKAYPGFLVDGAELLCHSGHNAAGHAAVGHYRNYPGEYRRFHPFHPAADAEDGLAATTGG